MTYDAEGLYTGDDSMRMRTYSGLRVDPMHVRPEDVNVVDIAHALARQCRFNGHCGGWLSVARHSVDVSRRLDAEPVLAKWGLMHDAPEAWLGDISRPMKHSGQFTAYLAAEEIAERAVAEAFGLPHPMPSAVKEADSASVLEELDGLWDHSSTFQRDETDFWMRYQQLWTP